MERRELLCAISIPIALAGCLQLEENGDDVDEIDGERTDNGSDRSATNEEQGGSDEEGGGSESGQESESGSDDETSEDSEANQEETGSDGDDEESDQGDEDGETEEDDSEDESTSDGNAVSVTGVIESSTGSGVSDGEVIALGDPEGLESDALNESGEFSLELTAGNEYTLQYTQGRSSYPDDDVPDLYTIDRIRPDSDTELGTVTVERAHELEIVVEDENGAEITDEAEIIVSHRNDGVVSGFGLLETPIEVVGEITVRAEYENSRVSEDLTVTEPSSVTLTFGDQSSDGDTVAVTGTITDSTGSEVTNGEVLALGGPEVTTAVPESDGTFSLELPAGEDYTLQYTQGRDSYPEDDVPDLYTIDRIQPESDLSVGTVEFDEAHQLEIVVEDSNGEEITDEAEIMVSHRNNGTRSGFELQKNPVEVVGDVTVRAEYDGDRSSESLTVTEPESVTLTIDG